MPSTFIKWLEKIKRNDISGVGGKAANLGEMFSRFPIPEGFCITVSAFDYFLKRNNSTTKIKQILKNIDINNIKNVGIMSNKMTSSAG